LHELDFCADGFEWLDRGENKRSVFSFLRKGSNDKDDILVICNFNNKACKNYTIDILSNGKWNKILSSDDIEYGGAGFNNAKSILKMFNAPPLSVTFFKK